MPLHQPRRAGLAIKTDSDTVRHVGDDADQARGLAKRLTVLTASQYAGTVNIDVPHYAAATISFTAATKTIADTANGLANVLTGDTITVRGSGNNDGVYTVAGGGVAASFTVNEALTGEVAGAYVSLCKREAHSNNVVLDDNSGRHWSRYFSGAKVGTASNGLLEWYNATKTFVLHPAAVDLQIIAASKTLRIVNGAAEVARYHVGDVLLCSGFANAVNNLPGYIIVSVTVNGADLDIVLNTINCTLVNEAAAGARAIRLICDSVFGYAAAANVAALAGYSDWWVPNVNSVSRMIVFSQVLGDGKFDQTAFPSQPGTYIWTSTVAPDLTTFRMKYNLPTGLFGRGPAGELYAVCLVRGYD